MIDTEALRKKVIDLAIQGKLTEQLPSDGDAETLYAQILDHKSQLIKEGKIKKDKALPGIAADEIPFEIPDNWKWVRVNSIGSWSAGATPSRGNKDYYDNGTIPWLKTGELNDGYITEAEEHITQLAFQECSVRINPIGSVLIAMYGATIGKVGILDIEATTNQACCACIPYLINNRFLFYFLKSNKERFLEASHGGAQPNISKDIITKSLMPLPPLAEQKRIVEVLDCVFNQFEVIDNLQAKYSNDLAVLKSKIIDAGIQGKLTEQLPEDGDAEDLYAQILNQKSQLIKEGKIKKEKSLPDITEDEIPFEVPKNWKWVRLSCISNKITDGTHHSPVNTSCGDFMYITAKNIKPFGISLDDISYVSSDIHDEIYSRCNPEKDDVLLIKDGATTGVVTVNNLDYPFSMLSSVALIKCSEYVEPWYLVYSMRSSWFSKYIKREMTGVGITRVVLRQIESFVMPLPPHDEQKRIVTRIEAIMRQLD